MELTTRLIFVKDLLDYIESEDYLNSRVVPISPQRARSHACNPRAQADDLALVLVYADGQMEAYLGVLPDLIYPTGIPERAGWLSCMWVNPDLRGRGIAKRLINAVFEYWQYRILVTEFTPEAKGLYDSTKQFLDLKTALGVRAYLRPNLAYLLPKKNASFNTLTPLWTFTDVLLSIPNRLRLLFYNTKAIEGLQVETEISSRISQFIAPLQEGEFMRRRPEDLNWILKNPWIKSAPGADEFSKRYHFTSVAHHFEFFSFSLNDTKNECKAFVILSLRDGHMRVPYAYFNDDYTEKVAKAIAFYAVQMNATMFTTYQPRLSTFFKGHTFPFYHVRTIKRDYIISKIFSPSDHIYLQDGDADAAFT